MFKDLFGRMKRDRQARDDAERDAPKEMGRPVSRETGGDPQPGAQDANSSTGTTPNETFVGRAGGDESGDVQTSGSEMRAGETDMDDQGAARDE